MRVNVYMYVGACANEIVCRVYLNYVQERWDLGKNATEEIVFVVKIVLCSDGL